MTAPPARRHRNPLQWFAEGGWYYFVIVLSAGVLSPLPFAHAAARLRNRLHWITPIVYLVVVATIFATIQPGRTTAADWLIFPNLLVPLVHLTWLRRKVWPVGGVVTQEDPAVAAALAARQRRADARKIVVDDPLLARELQIGRPDLHRDYDDGGLVDLNSAPAAAIAAVCGIDAGLAERIVEVRGAAPFGQVDDLFAWTDVPVGAWDRIRDRAVVVPG